MNKQNSPEYVVSQPFARAKREWHNMSKTHLASYPVGFQVPALVQPLTGNTTVVLDMDHALQTNPTVTPVFDSMRVNVRAFFAPARLYTRGLIGNNFVDTDYIENIELPIIHYHNGDIEEVFNSIGGGYFSGAFIPLGSLLDRLGYPCGLLQASGVAPLDPARRSRNLPTTVEDDNAMMSIDTWNMMPLIAYYDICARFLSNPYDQEIPFVRYDRFYGDELEYIGDDLWNLRDIQSTVAQCRGYNVDIDNSSIQVPSLSALLCRDHYHPCVTGGLRFGDIQLTLEGEKFDAPDEVYKPEGYTNLNRQACQLGLWPSQYLPDYTTTWLPSEDIENLMATEIGSDVESYRLGKSQFSRKLRSILNGKFFDDWVEIHFGYKLKTSDHPIMVGKDSFHIRFNDVLNQSSSNAGVPLGASASRGDKGSAARRRISFTTQEPGFLFVIVEIVPYVTYSQFLPNWLDWHTFSSFPLPEYGGRSFQDLTIGDTVNTGVQELNQEVIGKQPIYYDFMTNRDTVGGLFNGDLLDTYTFKRKFDIREMSGGGSVFDGVKSTYMRKLMYDYAFPDWGQNGGENIFIKHQFAMRLLQPIPRQVIKNQF